VLKQAGGLLLHLPRQPLAKLGQVALEPGIALGTAKGQVDRVLLQVRLAPGKASPTLRGQHLAGLLGGPPPGRVLVELEPAEVAHGPVEGLRLGGLVLLAEACLLGLHVPLDVGLALV
jgi:hypothetical protein